MKYEYTDQPDSQNTPLQFGWKNMFVGLWQDVFPLIKANLCFLLYCLPVVTIPVALCALHAACTDLIRGKKVKTFGLYKEMLKKDFFRAWGVFLAFITLESVAIYGATFYFDCISQVYLAAIPGVLLTAVAIIGLLMVPYAFTMLARVDLPLPQVLKNAFLLAFLNLKFSTCSGLIVLLLFFLQYLYWLYLIPLIITCGIAIPFYFSTYFSLYGIKRFILPSDEE